MSTILVTGATGFIGSQLVPVLRRSHRVICLARQGSAPQGDVWSDPGDVDGLLRLMEPTPIDGVIHLATCYIGSHSPDQLEALLASNISFGTRVAEAASRSGVKWWINTGTIFQHVGGQPYSPLNLYAATKQAFEDLLQYYSDAALFRVVTLKIADTYGPNDPRRKLVPILSRLSSGDAIDMASPDQEMDLVYIDDIISGFRVAIDQVSGGFDIAGSLGLFSRQPVVLSRLVDLICQLKSIEIVPKWRAISGHARLEETLSYPCDNLPGWAPQVSLEEGLRTVLGEER